MNYLNTFTDKVWFQLLLFWIAVFLFTIFSSHQAATMPFTQASAIYGTIVFCQMLAAVVCMRLLIPKLLNKGKTVLFALSLLLLMVLIFAFYITIRMNYLEIKYFDFYNRIMPDYIKLSLWERLFDLRLILAKGISYLSPTALLLLIKYYRKQQEYLTLNEQKKTAELSALKNQLNPHFLFNTLNNLYTLSLQKSDKAPEVISVLSDILDYMLYRCNEKYVSLDKEIELIENYITLEKVRYGKRAKVSFNKSITENVKIAPLILLTFIENAFKHGVSQEINVGEVDIRLSSETDHILFIITNSIPNASSGINDSNDSIGLLNVKKQLELLYPDNHSLEIQPKERHYTVRLKLNIQ